MAGLLSDLPQDLCTCSFHPEFPPSPSLSAVPHHASALGPQGASAEGPSLIYSRPHDPVPRGFPSEPNHHCNSFIPCFCSFVCGPLDREVCGAGTPLPSACSRYSQTPAKINASATSPTVPPRRRGLRGPPLAWGPSPSVEALP